MSNLSEAISEMRNMRESYDQIGAAAEAYNTGKVQLAQNITSKGVPASASETLPELAEKVSAIAQDSYTIQGGEMYAKQLFGSLETPNYWNLYEVLAQLLSDGRLVQYGGILLAEYSRGYDSLALSGAGAGGAYVVSDKDENGQFKMYTEDTTHTWATEFDGKGNRWVAYCFADEYHDFQITDTNTSPRSIYIGRKVGTITSLVDGRISQIVVPDGNELQGFKTNTFSQNFGNNVILRNVKEISAPIIYGSNTNIEKIYIETDKISSFIWSGSGSSAGGLIDMGVKSLVIKCNVLRGGLLKETFSGTIQLTELIISCPDINCPKIGGYEYLKAFKYLRDIIILNAESCVYGMGYSTATTSKIRYIYLEYGSENNKQKSVSFSKVDSSPINPFASVSDVELLSGWNKPLNIAVCSSLTEENMYAHILQRLKQDEPDCGDGVTITLGATNLAKLTSQESIDLLDLLTNTYGYTFA